MCRYEDVQMRGASAHFLFKASLSLRGTNNLVANAFDITCSDKNFNGYKIESIKNDFVQLFAIGNKKTGAGASDPAIIKWNYKKKLFKVVQPQ